MDRLFADMSAVNHAEQTAPNPVDQGYNVAVRHLANRTCPRGWKEYPTFAEAPTTLEALVLHAHEHGVLGIATEDCDGTIFDCADTNVHLRAWHDSVHFRHMLAFNVAGEAAAVYVQVAQLYRVYGVSEKTIKWAQLLLADILGLVLNFQKTGKYPQNKRNGTVNEAKRWRHVAEKLTACVDIGHEEQALAMARDAWGSPREGY